MAMEGIMLLQTTCVHVHVSVCVHACTCMNILCVCVCVCRPVQILVGIQVKQAVKVIWNGLHFNYVSVLSLLRCKPPSL